MIKVAARLATVVFACAASGCGGDPSSAPEPTGSASDDAPTSTTVAADAADVTIVGVDDVAERFVKLALAIGQHDAAFVDAYHGPESWAKIAETQQRPLEALEADARDLLDILDALGGLASAPPSARTAMLRKNIVAALTRIRMARGETLSFDEETRLLYDVVAPAYDTAEFDAALRDLDALLPGDAPLNERVDAFRASLAIPADKLDAVFDAAIAECRKRSLAHYDMPDTERFSTEFVTDKPWSGYNWYQGDYESLIQVNTDFPVIIDRAVDLGCHEGYPGHHMWNVFIERDLLEQNGWIEYSVYPLFSPQSLIAEGSANYGIELAFPGDEKIAFERDVLFPLAGLDPARAETLEKLNKARSKLSHARNHVARRYLDGEIDREQAIVETMKYSLVSRERAEQSTRFVETYRGYVVNYNLGLDLVRDYVERSVDGGQSSWDAFAAILTAPTSASDLVADDAE
ncbi:MAG: hypothetical protein AAGJ87_08060 [Pseudomonadota bacterium]